MPDVSEISDELKANYEQVRQDRGWSWAQLAENVDTSADPSLAAFFRSKSTERKTGRGKQETR